jgi:hypothetical protein
MSYTESTTFTVTHARHMAAKVATDLKRVQRFYGEPTDDRISNYEKEVTELLKAGYLDNVTYGFQRAGKWTEPTLRYAARDLAGASASDDDPGRVRPGANISGAEFRSFMEYSSAWYGATQAQRDAFRSTLPFKRGDGDQPSVDGYLSNDKTYSAGGRALDRATVRSF